MFDDGTAITLLQLGTKEISPPSASGQEMCIATAKSGIGQLRVMFDRRLDRR
jgi:hypothetical protein